MHTHKLFHPPFPTTRSVWCLAQSGADFSFLTLGLSYVSPAVPEWNGLIAQRSAVIRQTTLRSGGMWRLHRPLLSPQSLMPSHPQAIRCLAACRYGLTMLTRIVPQVS